MPAARYGQPICMRGAYTHRRHQGDARAGARFEDKMLTCMVG